MAAGAGDTLACECLRIVTDPITRDDVLRGASVAFVGWPVSVSCILDGQNVVAFDYVFEVSETWLPASKRVTIRTPLSTCGLLFGPGVRYLVIGYGTPPPSVNRCSETAAEADAQATLALLNKPLQHFPRTRSPRTKVTLVPRCVTSAAN